MRTILTAFLLAIVFCSCEHITGSGNIITQTRNPNHFQGVQTSGSIDVEIMNDATPSVKVEADDNVMQYIVTDVNGGLLNVHYKNHISFDNIHVKVYVSAPDFNKLFVAGSGAITSKNTVKTTELETKVSGSGDINAIVDAPSVTANIGGSGTISLEGRTRNFDCSIGGSGDIKCNRLLSENTTVSITGSGTAHVFASIHLVAKVTGSGDVYYSGNPPSPEIHTTGSGSIQAEK